MCWPNHISSEVRYDEMMSHPTAGQLWLRWSILSRPHHDQLDKGKGLCFDSIDNSAGHRENQACECLSP
jgi:hypothetical protein